MRFARLIHRPGRVLGGPAVRAACSGDLSLPWLPRRVLGQDGCVVAWRAGGGMERERRRRHTTHLSPREGQLVREEQNPGRCDFFVSYTGVDTAWAEWVAWQLKQAGYTVT